MSSFATNPADRMRIFRRLGAITPNHRTHSVGCVLFGEERNRGLVSPSMLHSDEWHQFAEEFSESSEKLVAGEKNRSFSGRSRRLSSSR